MDEGHIGSEEKRCAPLKAAVGITADRLQRQYLAGQGEDAARARAVLAKLRRGAGRSALDDPLALEQVLGLLHPTLTEDELGRGDQPSLAEDAAFQAMTLLAVHLQSADFLVHRKGTSFATACGLLATRSESKSMKPRFDALLLAKNPNSQLTHIRSLVTLLRGQKLGFDYGAFAHDLRWLHFPKARNGILLRWGRDFAMDPYHVQPAGNSDSTIN